MLCLTFDTDWMGNQEMEKFLVRFPFPGKGTFFLHQHLPSLHTTGHELCPHPFINDLGNWQQGLAALAKTLPKPAAGVRPHSCVFSHMVGIGLQSMGYSYVSQATNLYEEGLTPFRHPWGIWEMPIYYMDNMDFWMVKNWPDINHVPFDKDIIRRAVSGNDLYVFDFHPLHIALNTRSHEDYVKVKDDIVQGKASPFDLRFPGRGTATFFEELCEEMERHKVVSHTCSEALTYFRRPRG